MMYDLCVIGAGPAGLFAAATVSKHGLSCILLEKMEKTGRKLRITGKGRCNITNTRGIDDFLSHVIHGAEFITPAITNFSSNDTVKYMESLAVETIEERGGRIFPKSGKARDVAQAMVDDARKSGTTIKLNCKVTDVSKKDESFSILTENGTYIESRSLLIATGGASYPSTGSTGDGYAISWKLGHSIIPVRPSLTHLEIKNKPNSILLKNVKVSIIVDNETVSEDFGEVEFNDRGMAGAAILSQSIFAVDAILDNRKVSVSLDLKPALCHEQIIQRIKRENSDSIQAKDLFRKFVPGALIGVLSSLCRIKINEHLNEDRYRDFAHVLKNLRFDVKEYGDFPYAITTAGGICLKEINPQTMESKLCDRLYFAGEIMDIDAKTGGYNIQLALSTAALAAKSIVSNE